METERERGKELLSREEAREGLAEAWLTFWSSARTSHDSEIRNKEVHVVLDRLSLLDREYFLHEETGKHSELAKIREAAKALARTGKKDTPSAGERRHKRRQKAAKHGTSPKKIR